MLSAHPPCPALTLPPCLPSKTGPSGPRRLRPPVDLAAPAQRGARRGPGPQVPHRSLLCVPLMVRLRSGAAGPMARVLACSGNCTCVPGGCVWLTQDRCTRWHSVVAVRGRRARVRLNALQPGLRAVAVHSGEPLLPSGCDLVLPRQPVCLSAGLRSSPLCPQRH